ncbi:MAG: thioredoxin [Oscillospiraceae bacterium]|nr:thioredoxin [Oscillospiraceae bacterium]
MEIKSMSEFNERVMDAASPVLVDFFAEWCGPCRMMAPLIGEIAKEASGFEVYKVNVDEVPEAAQKFGISSIPTFVAVKNGSEIARHVGAASKQVILSLIEKAT